MERERESYRRTGQAGRQTDMRFSVADVLSLSRDQGLGLEWRTEFKLLFWGHPPTAGSWVQTEVRCAKHPAEK